MIIGFKEQFAGPVEAGTKRQTIRQPSCVNKTCILNGGQENYPLIHNIKVGKPLCAGTCPDYVPRIKPNDTLQLYTGLMQRKYCKDKGCSNFGKKVLRACPDLGPMVTVPCRTCDYAGAKLLKTATCTKSFPIKFEDLTEEIARLDGFKDARGPSGHVIVYCALKRLKDFLIKTYNAKDGDVFQVIRWEA